MQEGSFRCDANVSVRRPGAPFGTRCEIKNLNSFRFMHQAIVHEAKRQIELIESGGTVVQQTRLYDPDRDETRSMRSKEDAMDYRYFPDPDLLPLEIPAEWVERVRAVLPELPAAMRERFVAEHGLSAYDAGLLTATRATADYFEAVVKALPAGQAKAAANWVNGDVSAALNAAQTGIEASPVAALQLAGLIARVADGTINQKTARDVFTALWQREGESADAIIEARGLRQISDSGALATIVDAVLAANPKSVEEFRAGKEKAFNALVGQVMKQSRGKANPQQVNEILRAKLGA
jgi:aspartyl-tRNA(Asn)/glutamyl-tRNA(Gln) amidotransferase subunit B